MIFKDRQEAGKKLGNVLLRYKENNPIILALPRGGVPVGFEIAKILGGKLDIVIVRKLGYPHKNETGIGAIAEGNELVLNTPFSDYPMVTSAKIKEIILAEQKELRRRINLYRKNKRMISIRKKTVILVDDGLATGASMRVAISLVKKFQPKKIVVAVPVGEESTISLIGREVDEAVCLAVPYVFQAVGMWYDNFPQVTDGEVIHILRKANELKHSNRFSMI